MSSHVQTTQIKNARIVRRSKQLVRRVISSHFAHIQTYSQCKLRPFSPKKVHFRAENRTLETLANFDISLNNNTLGLEQIKPKLINMVALKRADWVVDLKVY